MTLQKIFHFQAPFSKILVALLLELDSKLSQILPDYSKFIYLFYPTFFWQNSNLST